MRVKTRIFDLGANRPPKFAVMHVLFGANYREFKDKIQADVYTVVKFLLLQSQHSHNIYLF